MIETYCKIHNIPEVSDLKPGMDFRKPEYRKEVFIRLFEFHTSYGIQPGLVYLFLPYMREKLSLDIEQCYWMAFLEGCTENPCTVYAILQSFPTLPKSSSDMETWHKENWKNLQYDIDTRYNKGHLVEQVDSYLKMLNGRYQEDVFHTYLYSSDKEVWFNNVWKTITSLYKFGRLTSWSYAEFIKISTGLDYEYSSLKMEDRDGSRSHRNGCLRVMGRDDLEWWLGANNGVTSHSDEICESTENYGEYLTEELKNRFGLQPWGRYIGYETVESTLCAFKNMFHGRRYPNIYTDMSYDRIKKAEDVWGGKIDFSLFWNARKEKLPKRLLLEFNPQDPGLVPEKQEYFKNTGHIPMMSVMDKTFSCGWDDYYNNIVEKTIF